MFRPELLSYITAHWQFGREYGNALSCSSASRRRLEATRQVRRLLYTNRRSATFRRTQFALHGKIWQGEIVTFVPAKLGWLIGLIRQSRLNWCKYGTQRKGRVAMKKERKKGIWSCNVAAGSAHVENERTNERIVEI